MALTTDPHGRMPHPSERRPIRPGPRLAELDELAGMIESLEDDLAAARKQLDAKLYYAAHDGLEMKSLAEAARMSRETAYKAVKRHQAHVAPRLVP